MTFGQYNHQTIVHNRYQKLKTQPTTPLSPQKNLSCMWAPSYNKVIIANLLPFKSSYSDSKLPLDNIWDFFSSYPLPFNQVNWTSFSIAWFYHGLHIYNSPSSSADQGWFAHRCCTTPHTSHLRILLLIRFKQFSTLLQEPSSHNLSHSPGLLE